MNCPHENTKFFSKCLHCGEIFLPSLDHHLSYFDIFEIKPSYFLNLNKLTEKFYELSRILHPDRYQTKSARLLALATHWSALLNQALETFRDPEELARYLFILGHFKS